MKRSFFDDKRDQTAADTYVDPVDRVGRCHAQGCPNIWTHKESGLCRWHSAAPPHMWPLVSQELQHAVTDAVMARQNVKPVPVLSRSEKAEILRRMRSFVAGGRRDDPRAWAKALRAREEGGERLALAQKSLWRSALGPTAAEPGDA